MPVRLPMHPEMELHMVVVKGFGEEPMMLLTSLPVNGSFESMWRIVEGCLMLNDCSAARESRSQASR